MLDIDQADPCGAVGEGVQALGQQIRAGLGRTAQAPGAQMLVHLQQQVHRRHEEIIQAQRIATLRHWRLGYRQGQIQLFQQGLAFGDQLRRPGQGLGQSAVFEGRQPPFQQGRTAVQQGSLRRGEGHMGDLVFPGQPLERRGQLGHGRTAGHVGTALQGMQRPQEIVGYR